MQYTEQEIAWFQQAVASGQYTQETAIQAIMVARQPAAAPAAQPVAQGYDANAYAALAEFAAEEEDHTATNTNSLPAAGQCWIRFLNFIEVGLHQGKNKTHKPTQVAIITVELHSPAHMYEKDGVKVPQTMDIRIPKSQGQNSRWPKFVKAIQRALRPVLGYDITHMSQAIGHACLGTIYHNTTDGDTYANLDVDKQWSFQPAKFTNPATGVEETVNIPPLHGTPGVFMMNNQKLLADPVKMKFMWDSIFVDGFYETDKADGTKEKKSRNYYQRLIASSIGWEQSPAKRILDSVGCTTTWADVKSAVSSTQQVAAATTPVANVVPQVAGVPSLPQVQTMPQVAQVPTLPTQPAENPAFELPAAGAVQAQPVQQAMQPVMGVPSGMPQPAPSMQVQSPAMAPQAMDAAAFMSQFSQ